MTAFLLIAIAYIVVVYVLPIAYMLITSVQGGWGAYSRLLSTDLYPRVMTYTFVFAAVVTLFSLLVSYPIAYLARTTSSRVQWLVLVMATIPLWTSLLVRTFAWILLLGRRGIINYVLMSLGLIREPLQLNYNSFGTFIGSVYIMVPLMVLTVYTGMRSIDLGTVHAARTLGARPALAFLRVFWPQSVPGVVAGVLLVFIVSLGFFVTPALLGGPGDRTLSMLMAVDITQLGDFDLGSAAAALFLVVTLVILALYGKFIGFDQFVGGRMRAFATPRVSFTPIIGAGLLRFGPLLSIIGSRWWLRAAVTLFLLWLIVPFVAIIPLSLSGADYLQFPIGSISPRWFEALAGQPLWVNAGISSLEIGLLATALALVVGILGALGLRSVGPSTRSTTTVLFMVPAMIPTMIYSLGAYFLFAKVGLIDSPIGLSLAHAALGVPFVVIIVATALSGIHPSIEDAARSLGADTPRLLRRVLLPLVAPALVFAAVIAFQTSFDEVVVALFLSGVRTRTLPKAMWDASTLEVSPILYAIGVVVLAVILVVAAIGLLVIVLLRRRRRMAVGVL
jgi:ABC-type spermidine/putrescine transport system permease subunit I